VLHIGFGFRAFLNPNRSGSAAGILRRVRIQYPELTAAKSLQPQISRKVRKFPRHFKGHFSIGNVQVRILRGQPAIPAFSQAPLHSREWAGNPGFRAFDFVSGLPVRRSSDGIRRKSPVLSPGIPVLRRLSAETGAITTAARGNERRMVRALKSFLTKASPSSCGKRVAARSAAFPCRAV